MRLNRLALIGLGILGLVFVWVLFLVFRPKPTTVVQDNTADPNIVQVNTGDPAAQGSRRGYVARYNIPARTILTRDMFAPDTSGSSSDETIYVTDFLEEGYGYITKVDIPKGRHLQHDQLLGSVRELGVSGALNEGFRAMTIAVPNKPTLHSIVSVGDFVDVIGTFDQMETRVLADGVRVLAVDVYGRDYEKASISKRGPYSDGPNAPAAPAPGATPVPGQRPGEPVPTPAPQGNQPPPPAREAALTLEVRPEQATAISFAIASAAPLDYLIQPRPTTLAAPQITTARTTKAQVAPYALASKRSAGGTAQRDRVTTAAEKTLTKIGSAADSWKMPSPGMGTPLGPMPVGGTGGFPTGPMPTPKPRTYDITIYPDGLPPRINTVPIPD
ncbi:MAG TPA: RcpC/CpaB family pilus assembly protein [Abditibacteriaceae bacterium]|jgi:Flp pilus assembly protein CpaB